MPLLQFGEWRPDVADYGGQTTHTIQNVIPRGDGYDHFHRPLSIRARWLQPVAAHFMRSNLTAL